jgi:hypothetical protein
MMGEFFLTLVQSAALQTCMEVIDSQCLYGLALQICANTYDVQFRILSMTDEEGKIIAALEEGQATPEQQKEAAHIIRDLDRELRELMEWEQRD